MATKNKTLARIEARGESTFFGVSLSSFVGGQAEIQNPPEGYLYRGDIERIRLGQDTSGKYLEIRFAWLAKRDEAGWVEDEIKDYKVHLAMYSVSDIGDGRIFLQCPYTGEGTTLFPRGGSALTKPF